MKEKKSRTVGSAFYGEHGRTISGKDRRFGHHFVDFYNSSLAYGRKKRRRIKRLNCADEIFGHSEEEKGKSHVAGQTGEDKTQIVDVEDQFREETNLKVREAVERLSPLERQFVEYFYFEDKSYREISVLLNKSIRRLERIHHRALGKLRMLLSGYVKTRFKLNPPEQTDLKAQTSCCIICQSPFRQELDELIRAKKDEKTYKSLIRIFKGKYGLKIKTPQVIIGHKKKHMI
jgi:RNA polymerase sigma factor (sigma-70 family)